MSVVVAPVGTCRVTWKEYPGASVTGTGNPAGVLATLSKLCCKCVAVSLCSNWFNANPGASVYTIVAVRVVIYLLRALLGTCKQKKESAILNDDDVCFTCCNSVI